MLTIGERIKQMRDERGWKQGELAMRAGLSQPVISVLEGGSSIPTLMSLIAIANAFGLPLVCLLRDVYLGQCVEPDGGQISDEEWTLIMAYRQRDVKTLLRMTSEVIEV
jgi:transcriptional regulator with XRE-family HTH domain